MGSRQRARCASETTRVFEARLVYTGLSDRVTDRLIDDASSRITDDILLIIDPYGSMKK